MAFPHPRRMFLKAASAGGLLTGLGDLAFLNQLPHVSAAETARGPVSLVPEIEPLVKLLEETPREQLLEKVAQKIKGGLSYQHLLAALQLAGVRNIQPRPSAGHKFHAVLVVNSAHIASLASPDDSRWLPIFWSLDYFKTAQARDVREGDWTMQNVDEARLPSTTQAMQQFQTAMDEWDVESADTAIAALARTHTANEIYEQFFRYGMRDFRSIGHKAIFVSNSWRTLQVIGWRYAEPVLRSLAYALLLHEGDNPAQRDSTYDRSWRENLIRAQEIRDDWQAGKVDAAATRDLLQVMREGSPAEASQKVVDILNAGIAPQSVWDALLCDGAELLVREPGISAIHNLTFSNALRFAYDVTANDETRRLILLQNAAFLPWMRQERMRLNGRHARFNLTDFQAEADQSSPVEQLETIFSEISTDRMAAAQQTLAYLNAGHSAKDLIDKARLLVFLKGNDAHDYKFSSAVLEDYYHLSPEWRDRYLASSVFNLAGTGDSDNQLVRRTREALQA